MFRTYLVRKENLLLRIKKMMYLMPLKGNKNEVFCSWVYNYSAWDSRLIKCGGEGVNKKYVKGESTN